MHFVPSWDSFLGRCKKRTTRCLASAQELQGSFLHRSPVEEVVDFDVSFLSYPPASPRCLPQRENRLFTGSNSIPTIRVAGFNKESGSEAWISAMDVVFFKTEKATV